MLKGKNIAHLKLQLQDFGMQLFAAEKLYPQLLDAEITQNPIWKGFLVSMRASFLGSSIGETSYPADWWQAFKDRWFPYWLKKKFPVKFNRIDRVRICPHIKLDWDKYSQMHFGFLKTGAIKVSRESKE